MRRQDSPVACVALVATILVAFAFTWRIWGCPRCLVSVLPRAINVPKRWPCTSKGKMGANARARAVGAGFLCLVGGAVVVAVLNRPPQVSLSVAYKDAGVSFQVTAQRANGLLGLLVYERETRKPLWYIHMNYFPGGEIGYGRVPGSFKSRNGNTGLARQRFPKAGAAPLPLPSGKEIVVQVDYQYDAGISARGGSRSFAFVIEHGDRAPVRPVANAVCDLEPGALDD